MLRLQRKEDDAEPVPRPTASLSGRRDGKSMLERFVRLYESRNAAEPGHGYAKKAAEWRAKLDEEATKPRSDEGTKGNDETTEP